MKEATMRDKKDTTKDSTRTSITMTNTTTKVRQLDRMRHHSQVLQDVEVILKRIPRHSATSP